MIITQKIIILIIIMEWIIMTIRLRLLLVQWSVNSVNLICIVQNFKLCHVVIEKILFVLATIVGSASAQTLSVQDIEVQTAGQTVVVIEDLVSTGKSSLIAVKALREKGCVVKGMAAIFTYGLQVAADNFKEQDVELVTLTDYDTLIGVAKDKQFIHADALESLAAWRVNPEKWSDDHMNA